MKDWALRAGLIEGHIPNQLKLVYEPDCASLSIQHALLRNLNASNDDELNDKRGHSSSSSRHKKKKNVLQAHRPQISIDAPFRKGDK